MKTKYYFVSDLHGTHPKYLLEAILSEGFVKGDITHQLVVAGDITDGLGFDEKLINCLKEIEKQGQLIAVQGNHDTWTINNEPMNVVDISEDNKRWLSSLPFQIDHKDFYLAHGIYTRKLSDKDQYNFLSTWGSPCLFEHPSFDWWNVSKETWEEIHKKWPKLQDYIKDHDDKPMIIGHFWPNIVKEKMDWRGEFKELDPVKKVDFTQDEKGFVSIGNIHYVDSDVLRGGNIQDRTRKRGTVLVKVMEL